MIDLRDEAPDLTPDAPDPAPFQDESLNIFLAGLARFPVLPRDEVIDLIRRHRNGDAAALNRLVSHNLRLVVSVAKRYKDRGLDMWDLIQEGTTGPIRALDKYDPARNIQLSTYAHWWIQQAITRAIANQGRTIRLPVHVTGKVYAAKRAASDLATELDRQPTTAEIAARLKVPRREAERLLKAGMGMVSLDAPMLNTNPNGAAGTGTMEDLTLVGEQLTDPRPQPEEAAELTDQGDYLAGLLRFVTAREARVLRLRYGVDPAGPLSLDAIGKLLGVTRERVRQIEAMALRKLRAAAEKQLQAG